MAAVKEKDITMKSLVWNFIILAMAILLIKYQGDFILSLIDEKINGKS